MIASLHCNDCNLNKKKHLLIHIYKTGQKQQQKSWVSSRHQLKLCLYTFFCTTLILSTGNAVHIKKFTQYTTSIIFNCSSSVPERPCSSHQIFQKILHKLAFNSLKQLGKCPRPAKKYPQTSSMSFRTASMSFQTSSMTFQIICLKLKYYSPSVTKISHFLYDIPNHLSFQSCSPTVAHAKIFVSDFCVL